MNTRPMLARPAVLIVALLASLGRAEGPNPGSLIVFPEFDTTSSRDTLLTVTNTSPTLSVRITYEYVSPTSPVCLMTNRHALLTPNDTLTVLASVHRGQEQQGFVYVFASNALGTQAFSHNYLIGDDLLLDGTEALEYAIQPLVFRALASDGSSTDLDLDGIRDLNGDEYEAAPGRILIPRFMGQSATHQSELILIGLSGGGRFTTFVDFLVFNDNEVALSAQLDFRCWTKRSLSSINGLFGNTFLQNNTGDASNEILGQSAFEAGWMIVEGSLAQSTSAVISDPAILAVLVESTGGRKGAEIPFIEGRRENGALFPQSATGQ